MLRMKKSNQQIWNIRMLQLMDHCVSTKKAIDQTEFLKKIGFTTTNNLKQVLEGKQSFRLEHFMNASKKWDISMEWFFGFSHTMKRKISKISAVDLIEEGLRMIKAKGK